MTRRRRRGRAEGGEGRTCGGGEVGSSHGFESVGGERAGACELREEREEERRYKGAFLMFPEREKGEEERDGTRRGVLFCVDESDRTRRGWKGS